ncbi:hypothetical protein ACS0TY_016630 [Phlomoides rotata]
MRPHSSDSASSNAVAIVLRPGPTVPASSNAILPTAAAPLHARRTAPLLQATICELILHDFQIWNLTNLVNLIVSANNLTSELPLELNNLKVLKEVRLSSNIFRGRLPSFQSWRELEELELQATGFEGPIPSTISVSMNLNELMISDLNI